MLNICGRQFLVICVGIIFTDYFNFQLMNGVDGHRQTMKQSIALGAYMMITYLAYMSFSNIITFIDEHQQGEEADGPIILAIANAVYTVALIYTPLITNFKRMFQIAALCHLISYGIFIPDFRGGLNLLIGIISAGFTGYSAALYWVSLGGYMMRLFKVYNIQPNDQGKYFGIANGITSICNLLGAAVTTFGLGLFGNQVYFSILTSLAVVSWLICTYFLKNFDDQKTNFQMSPQQQQKEIQDQNEKDIKRTIITDVSQLQQEKQLLSRNLAKKPLSQQLQVVKKTFIKTMSYYPKMYYLLLIVAIDNIMLGFTAIYLNKLLPEEQRTELNVGYLLMVQGVGCIFGAFTSAFACDRFQVISVIILGVIVIGLTCLATFITQFVNYQSLYYPFLVALMWGFSNSYIDSWLSVACARINKGSLQSFSICEQSAGVSYVCFTIAMIIADNIIDTQIFFVAFIGICVVAVLVLLYFKKQPQSQYI